MSSSSSSITTLPVAALLEESQYATFEARQAAAINATQADQIHWEREAAYRNQNYRHLYHQQGLIGTFHVRLLEAADLKRSYWSALAIGPVRLLGLSKAHGAVSSFVSCIFDPEAPEEDCYDPMDRNRKSDGKKPASKAPPQQQQQQQCRPCFVSQVIPHDDNPVWTNAHFDLNLKKGVLRDGQSIKLQLRIDEDATAVENILPGVPSGGDSRLLGTGEVDLTSLCLGQLVETGQPQAGVLDAWVPIYLRKKHQEKQRQDAEMTLRQLNDPVKKQPPKDRNDNENTPTGRVRVLVSYQPHGIEPQPRDIVALEVFARQDIRAASCRPILPPRLPLTVLETSGPWILVEYQLSSTNKEKACLKLHRNAVFVIERRNILDSTLNLALLPADVFLSTPLGQTTRDLMGPVVMAGQQLLAPALFSSRLLWMTIRATAMASLSGVNAATRSFVHEGKSSMTRTDENPTRHNALRKQGKFVTL
jgi:hypothetical protein